MTRHYSPLILVLAGALMCARTLGSGVLRPGGRRPAGAAAQVP